MKALVIAGVVAGIVVAAYIEHAARAWERATASIFDPQA